MEEAADELVANRSDLLTATWLEEVALSSPLVARVVWEALRRRGRAVTRRG
ncbi:hypothetical protein ATKI12_4432 [Kitasatospora sp. Ki12]